MFFSVTKALMPLTYSILQTNVAYCRFGIFGSFLLLKSGQYTSIPNNKLIAACYVKC